MPHPRITTHVSEPVGLLPSAAAMIWSEIRRGQRNADLGCYRTATVNALRLCQIARLPELPDDLKALAGAAAMRLERRITAATADSGRAA